MNGPLGLSVSLRVKCGTPLNLRAQLTLNRSPKMQSKLSAAIRDDRNRYTLQVNSLPDVDLSQLLQCVGSHDWNEMCRLGQSVHNDPNCVKSP